MNNIKQLHRRNTQEYQEDLNTINSSLDKAEINSIHAHVIPNEETNTLMNRYEDKYFLPAANVQKLITHIKQSLKDGDTDTSVRNNHNMTIYLDNRDLDSFRDNLEGIKPRFKVRIRRYNPNGEGWENVAYIELKIKEESGFTNKVRIRIPAKIIDSVAKGMEIKLTQLLLDTNRDISKQELWKRVTAINSVITKYGFKKQVVVEYNRRSFSSGKIRITIDDSLKYHSCAAIESDLLDSIKNSKKWKEIKKPANMLRHNDMLILEVKHAGKIPKDIEKLLKKLDAEPVSFSKYCAAIVSFVKTKGNTSGVIQRQKLSVDANQISEMLRSEVAFEVSEMFKNELNKGFKQAAVGLGMLAGLASPANVSNLNTNQPTQQVRQFQPSQPAVAKFGTKPEDNFLHNIMQVESSGGTNPNHPLITQGTHKGHKAIGKFALMPLTLQEFSKRHKMAGGTDVDVLSIGKMNPHKISEYLSKKPDLELKFARALARHVIKRHGETPNAAYAWKYGHNQKASDIDPHKRDNDQYIQKFNKLSQGKSVQGLNPSRQLASDVVKAEAELMKGSLQRKISFNPRNQSARATQKEQIDWTENEKPEFRESVSKMSGNPRIRALNKLAAKTHVRKHPETGERMFLMHRGMNEIEFKENHKNGIAKYHPAKRTSWTPDREVATNFGTHSLSDQAVGMEDPYAAGKATVSAWIPESSLLHNPNQFNAPSEKEIRTKHEGYRGGKKDINLDRSKTELEENEWIVQHDKPFQHANPKLIEQINKDRIRPQIKDKQFGVKAQIKGRAGAIDPDKKLLANTQIAQRPMMGGATADDKKLAASEIIENDINKMSQPSLTFPKLQGIPTRPDQEVKTIDPDKKFGNVSQQELENKKVASKYAAGSIKSPAEYKANKGNYLNQIKDDQVKNPNVKGYSASEIGDPYRMKGSNPMVQEHEAAHFILSKIGQHPEYGQEHKSALVNHLISHIHPEDQASIKKLLAHRGYQQGSDLNEEMLNTTRDLLVDEELRNQHNSLQSKDPSNYNPIDYNRLKQTWKNINNTSQNLSKEKLNSLVGRNPIMKKNEGSEKSPKNFFNHPQTKEMLHNEIKNMHHEVKNSEQGKRSGHKDESGQHVNTSTKSTFPSHYAKIGVKNKQHFEDVMHSKKGPIYDRMKQHAHDRLINGYSNAHGQDMPDPKYLVHAVKHGIIPHDDYKDKMRAMDKSEATVPVCPEQLEPTLTKPFQSEAQRKFAYANPEKFGGKEGIEEWESHTPKDIPKKKKSLKKYKRKYGLK